MARRFTSTESRDHRRNVRRLVVRDFPAHDSRLTTFLYTNYKHGWRKTHFLEVINSGRAVRFAVVSGVKRDPTVTGTMCAECVVDQGIGTRRVMNWLNGYVLLLQPAVMQGNVFPSKCMQCGNIAIPSLSKDKP